MYTMLDAVIICILRIKPGSQYDASLTLRYVETLE